MHVHSTIVQRLIGVDRRLFDIAQIVHSRVFIILNLLTPTVIDEWKPKKKTCRNKPHIKVALHDSKVDTRVGMFHFLDSS